MADPGDTDPAVGWLTLAKDLPVYDAKGLGTVTSDTAGPAMKLLHQLCYAAEGSPYSVFQHQGWPEDCSKDEEISRLLGPFINYWGTTLCHIDILITCILIWRIIQILDPTLVVVCSDRQSVVLG